MLLIALPALALVLALYFFGRYYVADELVYARLQNQALQQDLQTTLQRLEAEKIRGTVAEREADVVRRANALLRESEHQRQDQIARLQSDLAFYRRLGGANGSQAVLAIHHMELQPLGSPRVYRMIITLTQNLRWASVISGRIELGLDGISGDTARHLDGPQLLAENAQALTFRFKYFQQLECLITLPENFEPTRMTLRLKSNGLKTPVEQSMDWEELFNRPLAVSHNKNTQTSLQDD